MNISITGATGFIGQRLHQYLLQCGDRVLPITREVIGAKSDRALLRIINSSDVVINLAGESIDQRWTPSTKLRILESRIHTTRRLVSAINKADTPKHLISASAVGIYPSGGCHTDYSRLRASNFLADLCYAWEGEAKRLDPHNTLTITRFGVVFSREGGAYPRLTSTSCLGIMPRFGSSAKHLSWIDREDLVRAIRFIMLRTDLRGVMNLTAPELTTQALFLRAVKAPIVIPIPLSILRFCCGESADLVLQDCCTLPQHLLDAGFKFHSPTIADFITSQRKK